MLTVQTARPDPRLRPFLHSFVHRQARLHGAQIVEPVIARLGAILEFQFADPVNVPLYGIDAPNLSQPVTLIGPITFRRARILLTGHVEALSVLFQPLGFHALFGVPTSPLADEGIDAHSLLGPSLSALHQRLGNTPSLPDRLHLLNTFFLERLTRVRPPTAVDLALRRLLVPGPPLAIASLARQTTLSPRQLERVSLDRAGMSPRTLARIARFQRALRLQFNAPSSWTQVAHAAGYHDQTHMIRDFHDFASNTPIQTLRQIDPKHLSRMTL